MARVHGSVHDAFVLQKKHVSPWAQIPLPVGSSLQGALSEAGSLSHRTHPYGCWCLGRAEREQTELVCNLGLLDRALREWIRQYGIYAKQNCKTNSEELEEVIDPGTLVFIVGHCQVA